MCRRCASSQKQACMQRQLKRIASRCTLLGSGAVGLAMHGSHILEACRTTATLATSRRYLLQHQPPELACLLFRRQRNYSLTI